jgi:glycosyltransferase involved in cell wall biosynthesis
MDRPSRHLRVVHVVLSLDCGGLERMVLSLIRAGRARGQEVNVVCLERPGALAAEAEVAGALVLCAGKQPGLRPGTARRLKVMFKDLRPDVVHTHQVGALLYAGKAARSVGVPVIHTEHGNHLKQITSWLKRLKARWLFRHAGRRAARFCCVSAEIAETVQAAGVDARKIIVVANGIDTDATSPEAEVSELRQRLGLLPGARVIGTVGRLTEIKRQDLLIEAFARLKARWPEVQLLLVGDGDWRSKLEALAQSLGVAESVRFAGYQPRPEACLRLMDVFALTSRSEGMPVALLEAWAAGLPVAASRVGGIPELVRDGRNGLLFDYPDVPTLEGALERLLGDGDLRSSLGAAGREEVRRRFDVARTAAEYEAMYESAARAGKGAACASSS